jgi:hypothetical protein
MDPGVYLNRSQSHRMDRTSAVAATYGAVAAGDSDESFYGYGQPRSPIGWEGSSDEDSDDEFKGSILDNFDYCYSLHT